VLLLHICIVAPFYLFVFFTTNPMIKEMLYAGERRFFLCSGFFIEWNGCSTILTSASLVRKSGFENENKIDENLRVGS
jgi:hypothetical protein